MSNAEQVSQALAELWDIVKCRCHEAYTGRGLHDPDCECDSTDALQIVTDRIEALTKERDEADDLAKAAFADGASNNIRLAETAHRIKALTKERDAYAHKLMQANNTYTEMHLEIERLSDKLAKAVEALDMLVRDCEADYPPSHGAIKHFAKATLAEIKGESHD